MSNDLFPKVKAVAQRCYVKKVFLEVLQNSQENTFAKVSFLIKLQAFFHRTPLVAALRSASSVKLCCITLGWAKFQKINLFFGHNHNVFLVTL